MLKRRMERLFLKMRYFYVITVIASLHFFLILLKYKQDNEIRATMDWFLYDNGPRHERVKLLK